MNGLIGSRQAKALLLVPMVLLLSAARTSVSPLPETMIAVDSGHPLGQSFVARKGDVVMRAKIYDTEVVTLDSPITVSIAKFSEAITAGTKLDPVLAPEQTEQLTGTGGRFYCGQNQRTRSSFAEAMIGDMFSKYETQVRFCFVDSDADGKLDKVFLSGAKDKADQGARDIEPTAYTTKRIQPDDEAGLIELRVEKFHPKSNQVTLKLYQVRNGKDLDFSYILTIPSGVPINTYPTFKTNPKKVPYPAYFNDVLGGSVGVMRVDAVKEEAEFKVSRNFRMQLFKPISIIYQTIYIYY
jgi:hypothetical protein